MGIQERMYLAYVLLTLWRFLQPHHDIPAQSVRCRGLQIRLQELQIMQVGTDDEKSVGFDCSSHRQMDCQPTA